MEHALDCGCRDPVALGDLAQALTALAVM